MGVLLSNVYWFLLIFLIGAIGFTMDKGNQNSLPKKLIHRLETDSIRYDLWLDLGENGYPEQYYAEIFTPVCYSDKCYPVFIEFYWDLLGNFKHYKLPPGKTLTKNDHEEFQPGEYQKMQEILSNESSLLGDYKAEDLVVEQKEEMAQGVDAVTGATLKTLQNEVISGAVYSCYTLWHIAHGEITEMAKGYTEEIHDSSLMVSFLESDNHHYQYWAIDKVLANKNSLEGPWSKPLLEILRGDNIFIAQYLLKSLPADTFKSSSRQQWLWETFVQSPYRLQMAILEEMKTLKIHSEVQEPIVKQIALSNPVQQRAFMELLKSQEHLTVPAQKELVKLLTHEKWGTEVYRILGQQEEQDEAINKALKKSKSIIYPK